MNTQSTTGGDSSDDPAEAVWRRFLEKRIDANTATVELLELALARRRGAPHRDPTAGA